MKKSKLPDMPDDLVMLNIFEGCIRTGVLPAKGSPCHKTLKKVMAKEYKKFLKEDV